MFLDLVPDKDTVWKWHYPHKQAKQGLWRNQLNNCSEMLKFAFIIKLSPHLSNQWPLHHSQVVNEVLLQEMRLSQKAWQTDAILTFEEEVMGVYIFEQVTKQGEGSFLTRETQQKRSHATHPLTVPNLIIPRC